MLLILQLLLVFYQLADGWTGAPGASPDFYTSATSPLLILYIFQTWIGCRSWLYLQANLKFLNR
jgi:hypothetical protein